MRVTRAKAAENREKVVATAARLFREKGFDGVGLDAIMAEAGLTHGGFYRQFGSKEGLAAEALGRAFAGSAAWQAGQPGLRAVVDGYLSARHRDAVGTGCALAALAPEVARQGEGARHALAVHVREQIGRIAAWLTGQDEAARRRRAIATLAGLVGALALARAVDDKDLSDEILAAGRAEFGGA
jgi:TetR/AcrR family transcriptional regulator, transcriptional repressor for nem operon